MAAREDREDCRQASQERAELIDQVQRALYSKTTVHDPDGFVPDGASRLIADRVVSIELKELAPFSCERFDEWRKDKFQVVIKPHYRASVPESLTGTLDELKARKDPIVVEVQGRSREEEAAAERAQLEAAKQERLATFKKNLKAGDHALVKNRLSIDEQLKTTLYPRSFEKALVVELKPPLVQVQLFNPPETVWVEIEALRPLGDPCTHGHDVC